MLVAMNLPKGGIEEHPNIGAQTLKEVTLKKVSKIL
jgi:hypothetical protein